MTAGIDVWTDPDLAELLYDDAALIVIADALVAGADHRVQRRSRTRGPIVLALTVLILAAGLTPAVALSKTLQALIWPHPVRISTGPRVQATLTSHITKSAAPGTRIRVKWTLWSRNSAQQIVPFQSNAIFVQITNPTRTATSTASAHGKHGHYKATVRVPPGGIGQVQIGIVAERFGPNGSHPARVLIQLTNTP